MMLNVKLKLMKSMLVIGIWTSIMRASDGLTSKIKRKAAGESSSKIKLFESQPMLSKIDKSIVGIPVLADRLVQIQSVLISKCLPDIVKKVSEKLNASILELNKLPQNLTSIPDAWVAFMQIVGSMTEILQKILIRGEYLGDYENDQQMHCNARLVEMLDEFSEELQSKDKFSENFLVEEMKVLEEANGIRLPHFLPHSVFLCLLQRKVNIVSVMPINFVNNVWAYLEIICVKMLIDCCGNYPQLLPSMRKATQNMMAKMKVKFVERIVEMTEMEKVTDYTCDPDFNASYNNLMSNRNGFLESMRIGGQFTYMEGYGWIDVRHLSGLPVNTRDQAYDLKMRMTAYWKIVIKRMVEWSALQLRFFMREVVNKEIDRELVNVMMVKAVAKGPATSLLTMNDNCYPLKRFCIWHKWRIKWLFILVMPNELRREIVAPAKHPGRDLTLVYALNTLAAFLHDIQSTEIFRQSVGPKMVVGLLSGGTEIVNVFSTAATGNEILKEFYVKLHMDELIVTIIRKHSKEIIPSLYDAIRVLLAADDNRVLPSQVCGYARQLTKSEIADALAKFLDGEISSLNLVSTTIALNTVAVNGYSIVAKAYCSLLSRLTGNDYNKSAIVKKGGFTFYNRLVVDPSVLQEVMTMQGMQA